MAGNPKHSPIVDAIAVAEEGTTGEIRVHLSRHWLEKDAYARATKLFHRHGMTQTRERNGVLLYVNLRRKRFAVVGDSGIHERVGQEFWNGLAQRLTTQLQATHSERAIAKAVLEIGEELKKHFPSDGQANANELPNEVTED